MERGCIACDQRFNTHTRNRAKATTATVTDPAELPLSKEAALWKMDEEVRNRCKSCKHRVLMGPSMLLLCAPWVADILERHMTRGRIAKISAKPYLA